MNSLTVDRGYNIIRIISFDKPNNPVVILPPAVR